MREPVARYRTVEMHTGGEPVRLVLEGFPEPRGGSVLEKRMDAAARLDLHRRRLMLEPRGHAEMYGALIVPAAPPAAFGVLFMHHSGFSTMCGHATIALGRWATASGRVPMRDGGADFVLECPCGPVAVHVTESGRRVAFDSIPAFAAELDTAVEISGFGRIVCDIGYGGAFYAILPASRLGIDLAATPIGELRNAALAVMRAIRRRGEVRHPTEPELSFLYGAILTDDTPVDSPRPSRHLCVFGEEQIDRSATGSGVTARMAVDAARDLIAPGARRAFAGATGVPFCSELLAEGGLARIARGASASQAQRRSAAPRPGRSSRTTNWAMASSSTTSPRCRRWCAAQLPTKAERSNFSRSPMRCSCISPCEYCAKVFGSHA